MQSRSALRDRGLAERITLRNHHEPLLLRDEVGIFVCQSALLARVRMYVRFRGDPSLRLSPFGEEDSKQANGEGTSKNM